MAHGKYLSPSNLLVFGGIVLAGISSLAMSQSHHETHTDPAIRNSVLAKIETTALEGDLVFRSGRDMVSHLILSQSSSPKYSHVGVIVKHDGHAWVVHAMPDEEGVPGGVREESLADFASTDNASGFGLYRNNAITAGQRIQMADYLTQQKGKPFDDRFKLSDDTQMYCTELAIRALSVAGENVLSTIQYSEVMTLDEPVVTPDDLSAVHALKSVLLYNEG